MKILLSGYGRMGKEIALKATELGHEIIGVYDCDADWDSDPQPLQNCDVVIDFSRPLAAPVNIRRSLAAGKPIVSGTTGWYNHLPELTLLCEKTNGAIFYAPNFSLGVNIFLEAAEKLAQALNNFAYEASIKEVHHIHKADAPSGTAISLASRVIKQMDKYNEWQLVLSGIADDGKLPITSVREGEVVGIHELTFKSGHDMIRLTHEAFDRSGFVLGALTAAKWILNRHGIFTMKDLLKE